MASSALQRRCVGIAKPGKSCEQTTCCMSGRVQPKQAEYRLDRSRMFVPVRKSDRKAGVNVRAARKKRVPEQFRNSGTHVIAERFRDRARFQPFAGGSPGP